MKIRSESHVETTLTDNNEALYKFKKLIKEAIDKSEDFTLDESQDQNIKAVVVRIRKAKTADADAVEAKPADKKDDTKK